MRSRRFVLEVLVGLALAVPTWIAVAGLQWDIIGVVFSLGGPDRDLLLLPRLAVLVLAAATCFVFIVLRGAALAAGVVAVLVVTRSIVMPGGVESPTVLVLAGSWMGIAAVWLLPRFTTPAGWSARSGLAATGAMMTVGAWWLVAVAARAENATVALSASVALPSLALAIVAAAVALATLLFRALVPGALLVVTGLVVASLVIGRPDLIGVVHGVSASAVAVWEVRLDQLTDLAESAAFDLAQLALCGVSLAVGSALGLRHLRPAPSGEAGLEAATSPA